jgi:hypothetical protein
VIATLDKAREGKLRFKIIYINSSCNESNILYRKGSLFMQSNKVQSFWHETRTPFIVN